MKFDALQLFTFTKRLGCHRMSVGVQLDQDEDMVAIQTGRQGVDNDEFTLILWRNTIQRRVKCLDRTHCLIAKTDIYSVGVSSHVHDSVSCLKPCRILTLGLDAYCQNRKQIKRKPSHSHRCQPP